MTKYVLTYSGGGDMPSTDEEIQQVMAAWEGWYTNLADAVVDGGNPTGAAKTISPDGSVTDGGNITGYTLIQADSLDAATDMAKGCPVLTNGGTVVVSEAIDM